MTSLYVSFISHLVHLDIIKSNYKRGRNMKKTIFITLSLIFSSHLLADINQAESIFDAKCLACHLKQKPVDKSKVIAPAAMGVMRHLKQEYPHRAKAVAFIKDYVLAPSKEKAICMPQKIKRFGLMPSQKGNITKAELEKVAGWMFDNFPNKNSKGCKTNKNKEED
jgi:cytochrome c